MRRPLSLAVAAACAAGLAAAPAALATDTVIRVEGATQTLVPESAISIEGDGAGTLYDKNFTPIPVSRASALWQLNRAISAAGLNLTLEYFSSFGSTQVQAIGSDANAGTAGWQFRVNHVHAQSGPDPVNLAQGDRVLWYYGGGDGQARELDVTPSTDTAQRGTSFTVRVTSYDPAGAPAPGSGATVTYGGAQATADATGQATFIAGASGTQRVQATRAGDIRSPARAVCSYDSDPTVCSLPPAPAPAPPSPADTADTVAPGSAIVTPLLGRAHRSVKGLRGTAGPDRSDIRRVEVSLALRVGTQCRFRTRSGGLTKPRNCNRDRVYVTARTSGGNWTLGIPKGLAPGSWRVWSRATDGAGNLESVALGGVNAGTFRVLPKRAAARRAAAR
ncbi:MAG: hypothetical protein AB7V42_00045 [Thermoleophilia bacterium]